MVGARTREFVGALHSEGAAWTIKPDAIRYLESQAEAREISYGAVVRQLLETIANLDMADDILGAEGAKK